MAAPAAMMNNGMADLPENSLSDRCHRSFNFGRHLHEDQRLTIRRRDGPVNRTDQDLPEAAGQVVAPMVRGLTGLDPDPMAPDSMAPGAVGSRGRTVDKDLSIVKIEDDD